jgi:beta-galactosidase
MDIAFNNDWLFTENFDAGFDEAVSVRLPHTAKEIPYNYINCRDYQMVCGYRKIFTAPGDWQGKKLILRFDGAAHEATVFCNGERVGYHACGYTAFCVDITDLVRLGGENVIDVRLDTRESLNIPPFGFVIDYLCYGGLYREVTLEVKEPEYIKEVLIENTGLREIRVRIASECGSLVTDIVDNSGAVISSAVGKAFELNVPEAELWSVDSPALYTARVRAMRGGECVDEKHLRFGFRTVKFKSDGFYLNGERLKIRGLNRHQSYAYVGYAMPRSVQELDAEILKNELGVNAVRTSHYPQSQHFISRCDELGLLVFTEIPGWQHIGDEDWKRQAVKNTDEMVRQYMHHPSIMLWGVRINESQDCDELYRRTNAVAHTLDSGRQTSGVRYIEKSRLLEDVYAYNDFSHCGDNAGLKPKKSVTAKKHNGYLVSECNGHMFPTKAFDDERHRLDHALRHAKVLDAMYADDDISGIFPWCMFDYNTHQDFGSGDGICYHGVMDMFRNPKLASAVYASQSEDKPCCVVSSSMDIGEHPAGDIGRVYVFTNADCVRLYKDGVFVREFAPSREEYPALPHPPVIIDDFIGELLITQEGFDEKTAAAVKECLLAVAKFGPSSLPPKILAKFARLMLLKGFKFSDGVELYGKYIGNWGGEATKWRFDAVKGGKLICSVTRSPGQRVHLEVSTSKTKLCECDTYDAAAVRIRAVDEHGNLAPYWQEPVILKCSGPIMLIGPEIISLKGGSGGCYVKTCGSSGSAELCVNDIKIKFEINV